MCRLLNRHRARYVLAGGVAANLHGSVRATRDVDILVPKDRKNTMSVLADLLRSKQTGRPGELADIEALKGSRTVKKRQRRR